VYQFAALNATTLKTFIATAKILMDIKSIFVGLAITNLHRTDQGRVRGNLVGRASDNIRLVQCVESQAFCTMTIYTMPIIVVATRVVITRSLSSRVMLRFHHLCRRYWVKQILSACGILFFL
jgi:hypothetical protein